MSQTADRDFGIPPCGSAHHDHRQSWVGLLNFFERLRSAHLFHEDIQQNKVEFLGFETLERQLAA